MEYEEMYKKLPAKWEDVTLKTAINWLNVEMQLPVESDDELDNLEIGLNNTFKTIAVLTEASMEEVKSIPKIWIDKMAFKTAFMSKQPEPKKTSTLEWKQVQDITYDDFVLFSQLQGTETIDKMPLLIKAFSKKELTEEQIMNLDLVEVNTGFFLLKRQLIKFTQLMIRSSKKQLRKQKQKEKIQKAQLTRQK